METLPSLNDMLADAEQPDVDPARAALVKQWLDKVIRARNAKRTKEAFNRMREDMDFAARGADKKWIEDGNYVAPITNRHINLAVAQLYAKNPTVIAKPRRKMLWKLWDGRLDTLEAAMQRAVGDPTLGVPGDPMAAQMVQEVAAGVQYKLMLKRLGETLEILWDYFVGEQALNFKKRLKAVVRRAKVTGVGYVQLDFQRVLAPSPDIDTARIEDITSKITATEALLREVADDKHDETSAELEALRLQLRDLQDQSTIVVREGPVFDFPAATSIIIGEGCTNLSTFAGAPWIAREYEMTAERINEIYKVDVSKLATAYHADGDVHSERPLSGEEKMVYRVYRVWDWRAKQELTVCDGYRDFLKEPAPPALQIERFWPIFPLVFNEIEHDELLWSPSDVRQMRHMQMEINRSREALRQHRIAARPYYVEGGRMEPAEKDKLANHADHEIITMPSLLDGQKVEDLLQRGPTAPIDPNLYETEPIFSDIQRVVGTQEANFGGTSGGTATESSIAEASRGDTNADNVDELDELLSALAAAFGQVVLTELSKQTVIEIVGPGAVWPEVPESRAEVAKDLLLEIKAGSSGRPNRAAELANMERALPLMIQVPGVKPTPLAERYAELLDIDLEEAIAEGLPSITALNAIAAKMAGGGVGDGTGAGAAGAAPTGDPRTDPNQQGAQGANNAPGLGPNQPAPGPQPGYPTPTVVG